MGARPRSTDCPFLLSPDRWTSRGSHSWPAGRANELSSSVCWLPQRHLLWGSCLRLAATACPYLPLVNALESWLATGPGEPARTVANAAPGLGLLVPDLTPDPALVSLVASATPEDGRLLPAWDPHGAHPEGHYGNFIDNTANRVAQRG